MYTMEKRTEKKDMKVRRHKDIMKRGMLDLCQNLTQMSGRA